MSVFEQLWFTPDHTDPARVARVLAATLDMTLTADGAHLIVSGRCDNGFDGPVGGAIDVNDYTAMERKIDPEDFAIFDDVPMIWQLWAPVETEEEQQAAARAVFDRLAERLDWPAILTHDFDTLIATYDPERGVREFAPGTLSDGRHRHLWA